MPGAGEVLVRVRAAGLNGADMHQLAGLYPAPPGSPQDIPGLELAGEVVGRGPGAERFEVGDRVMSIVGGGGQAELMTVHERILMPVPDNLSWVEAGGVPEVFTTAHDARLHPGRPASPASICWSTAPRAASAARRSSSVDAAGARVTATVRNTDLHDAVGGFGAERLRARRLPRAGPLRRHPRARRRGQPDGQPQGAQHGRADRRDRHWAPAPTGEINLGLLMMKRARIHGSTLRARPLELKALTARAMERSVLPLLASGAVKVPIAKTYPLAEAPAAYEHFQAGGKLGKIVLTMATEAAPGGARPLSRAAGPPTTGPARGTPTRTRAWRSPRPATRRCWGRTAPRSTA